ncbi:unnamed protein product, partial [Ectocarpus sp. 12 AP-2014]
PRLTQHAHRKARGLVPHISGPTLTHYRSIFYIFYVFYRRTSRAPNRLVNFAQITSHNRASSSSSTTCDSQQLVLLTTNAFAYAPSPLPFTRRPGIVVMRG